MIYEKFSIPFDFQKFKREVTGLIADLDPVMLSNTFGGWSVTSSNGKYTDGWVFGSDYANSNPAGPVELIEQNQNNSFKGSGAYKIPTELCIGEIKHVVDWLTSEDFHPRRCRIMLLKSNGRSNYHRDFPDWHYGVRLHIPIVTNPHCLFITDEGEAHLPSDGFGFLLKVNRMHKVVNNGTTNRLHFICDFYDSKQKTQFHKLTEADRKIFQEVSSKIQKE